MTPRRGSRLEPTPLEFFFDGRRLGGWVGDTAASALLAQDVRLMGRSVKYRRARSVVAAGPEEPNALVTVRDGAAIVPNVPAPQLVLSHGMQLTSQNRWPSLRFNLSSVLGLCSGLFSAGFYYKTFIWPSWRTYEGLIRRLAGLGDAPLKCNLATPTTEHVRCDLLIVGAGPAGLAAALAAVRSGIRVVLCEREPVCGGELEFEAAIIDGKSAPDWVTSARAELTACGVRILTNTTVVGGSNDCTVAHCEPGGMARGAESTQSAAVLRIHAASTIYAMGSVERPIAFVDNDKPGVMLVNAAERYAARYGVKVAARVVLFGNHDRLYAAARRLMKYGIVIAAIVDVRKTVSGAHHRELRDSGIKIFAGHAVVAVGGHATVHSVAIASLESPRKIFRVPCGALLVSGGWSPILPGGLPEGGRWGYASDHAAFVATQHSYTGLSCGAANGHLELGAVLADGYTVGHAAGVAAARGVATKGVVPMGQGDDAPKVQPFWRSPAALRQERRQFVDLQNDVTVADLRQALAEGFSDIEHVKRYTTLGVGTEQGRTSGLLGAAIVAELSGRSLASVGASRVRPPFAPATLSSLCGRRKGLTLRPERRTPLHDWHAAHGGELESMGLWLRPRFYHTNGTDAMSAGIAEAARVRTHGGVVDVSTLGKIEFAGADASAFLDRMYLTKASTIKIGRSKYMVLLREDGMVLDDGIVMRIAADRFIATVSSGHSDHLLSHFEFWRDLEFAGRRVAVADVTESWAVIAVAGPASRSVLGNVLGGTWVPTLQRLTHMDFVAGQWASGPVRIVRASFSGELAFEVHCRPADVNGLWQGLIEKGLLPYGLEALDILRVEKGYLVSSEINGQTTPQDLGLDALVKLGNRCVGRELLDRPAFSEPSRPRLVGLRAIDGVSSFLSGAQLTRPDETRRPCGHVTSSVYSPKLHQWIGLGLVARDVPQGAALMARDPLHSRETNVQVTATVHVDPDGRAMRS